MTRPHVVHKAEQSRGPSLPPLFAVWCSAGDLDLTGLSAELAARWVAKHEGERA
jgi:hypothetical protein